MPLINIGHLRTVSKALKERVPQKAAEAAQTSAREAEEQAKYAKQQAKEVKDAYDSIKTTVPFLTAFVRQPGTEYKAGDTVYVKDGGANIRLSCVASGRTSDDELTSEGVTSLHEKRIFPVEKNFEFSHAHVEGGRIVLGDAMGIALETNEGNTKGTWSRIDANGDEMD